MSDLFTTRDGLVGLAYLVAAIFFIFGLRYLSNAQTARRGNQIAAIGMGIAILATFFLHQDGVGMSATNIVLIIVAIAIGGAASTYPSRKVPMTAMPQMVAIFNGMGGATAALVAIGEFMHLSDELSRGQTISVVLGVIIGSISFAGSVIAFLKLQEMISGRPIVWTGQNIVNAIVALGIVVLGVSVALGFVEGDTAKGLLLGVFGLSLLLGLATVLPIGGADMPVVIAILNSFTGVAAAITGFQLDNQALIVAGALVGASGAFLTLLMARAMNRSVSNVLFGAFGSHTTSGGGATGAGGEALPVREISAEDAAIPLSYAERVIIVPGYGLAVAQAQQQVRELADLLKERGVDVRYAIHPVAGRMPGHMNVLLAEANVAYDDLYEMEQINDDFANTDVALVIGANDVTNPAARSDTSSPIYGMPILNVDQAKNIIVLKRGMSSGFAGIENMLFHDPKTSMLFGDARASLGKLIEAVKAT
ncbi:MAG: NAD(P)(+) transhydrogenase (Re/Si-specific) subunit beta [Thermomicrobiales bacterium]|nr:NAD(P)(+) transhydrogenase (Re/Si-specific) subunit beta [Thermomicrobiales bacterium]